MSEDSPTATLAVPYAALQPDSFDGPGPLSAVSKKSQDGKSIDNAIAPDEAVSALWSLALKRVDEDFRQKWRTMDKRTIECRRHPPQRHNHGKNDLAPR